MKNSKIKKLRAAIAQREEQAAEIRKKARDRAEYSIRNSQPADDLTTIKGIGAAVAEKLTAADITHFEELAGASDAALEEAAKGFAKRAEKGDWRAQAEELAKEKPAVEIEDKDLGFETRITGYDLWSALDLDATDIDNSKRMIARFDGKLIVVEGIAAMIWDGKRWYHDEQTEAPISWAAEDTAEAISMNAAIVKTAEVYGLIDHYCVSKKDAKEMRADPDFEGRIFCHEEIAAQATAVKSQKAMTAMGKIAQTHMGVSVNELDKHAHLLTVENGTIDLRTGEVLKHNPDHLITRKSPFFVPTTTDDEGRRWVKFDASKAPLFLGGIKSTMLHDADLLDYLWRFTGYLLTGETTEQKFWFLSGGGSNMKGKYCGTIASLLPDHYAELDVKFLMRQRNQKDMSGTNEELADLRGARIIHAEEGDENDVLDEAPMKKLSGGGFLSVSKKFRSNVRFKPCGKIVYETNHKPRVLSQDTAIWRRIVDIPFRAHFANPGDAGYIEGVSLPRNNDFDRDVEPELPHILAWAVMGAVKWYEVGLSKKIPEPQVIQDARRAYMEETDVLADFINAACDRDPEASQMQGQLYTAYENFCALNATGNPISRRAFGTALKERLFERFDKGGNRYRSGLCLNRAGWSYHRNERPSTDVDLTVVPPEPEAFEYRLDTKTGAANSVDELTYEVRIAVEKDCNGLVPPIGRQIWTRVGMFERTA